VVEAGWSVLSWPVRALVGSVKFCLPARLESASIPPVSAIVAFWTKPSGTGSLRRPMQEPQGDYWRLGTTEAFRPWELWVRVLTILGHGCAKVGTNTPICKPSIAATDCRKTKRLLTTTESDVCAVSPCKCSASSRMTYSRGATTRTGPQAGTHESGGLYLPLLNYAKYHETK